MGQAFGQGFDSPHLHQQVMDRSDAILFYCRFGFSMNIIFPFSGM